MSEATNTATLTAVPAATSTAATATPPKTAAENTAPKGAVQIIFGANLNLTAEQATDRLKAIAQFPLKIYAAFLDKKQGAVVQFRGFRTQEAKGLNESEKALTTTFLAFTQKRAKAIGGAVSLKGENALRKFFLESGVHVLEEPTKPIVVGDEKSAESLRNAAGRTEEQVLNSIEEKVITEAALAEEVNNAPAAEPVTAEVDLD